MQHRTGLQRSSSPQVVSCVREDRSYRSDGCAMVCGSNAQTMTAALPLPALAVHRLPMCISLLGPPPWPSGLHQWVPALSNAQGPPAVSDLLLLVRRQPLGDELCALVRDTAQGRPGASHHARHPGRPRSDRQLDVSFFYVSIRTSLLAALR